jgi:hypothetical protein
MFRTFCIRNVKYFIARKFFSAPKHRARIWIYLFEESEVHFQADSPEMKWEWWPIGKILIIQESNSSRPVCNQSLYWYNFLIS